MHSCLTCQGPHVSSQDASGVGLSGGLMAVEGNPYHSTSRLWDDGIIARASGPTLHPSDS